MHPSISPLPQKWNVSQTKIRVISTLLFILFGCLIFVTLPAIIFKHIEGWSTLEAIYFVVITLTTIGFGDFVAGEGERRHHQDNNSEWQHYTSKFLWFNAVFKYEILFLSRCLCTSPVYTVVTSFIYNFFYSLYQYPPANTVYIDLQPCTRPTPCNIDLQYIQWHDQDWNIDEGKEKKIVLSVCFISV